MIVAIHQPNYLPWLGYFEKIIASDVFIILDHVQHIRQSLTRRVCVRKCIGSGEKSLITVQLSEHDRFSPINELKIKENDWWKSHRDKIHSIYKDAPFYESVSGEILSKLSLFKGGDRLSELNYELIRSCCIYMGVRAKFRLSSNLKFISSGSALMAELTEVEGGTAYYSGGGAGGYSDENDFGARGLAISYQRFSDYMAANPYQQLQGDWLPGLSVIDALFNLGPNKTVDYLRGYSTWERSQPLTQDWDPLVPADPMPTR